MIWLSVGLLLVGLTFLVIEGCIPGFGFFGIMGFLLITASAVYSMLFLPYGQYVALGEILVIVGLALVTFKILKKNKEKLPVILHESLAEDNDKPDYVKYIGKVGKVKTALKPFGNIEVDGEFVEAYSENGFIPAGAEVECRTVSEGKLFVKQSD